VYNMKRDIKQAEDARTNHLKQLKAILINSVNLNKDLRDKHLMVRKLEGDLEISHCNKERAEQDFLVLKLNKLQNKKQEQIEMSHISSPTKFRSILEDKNAEYDELKIRLEQIQHKIQNIDKLDIEIEEYSLDNIPNKSPVVHVSPDKREIVSARSPDQNIVMMESVKYNTKTVRDDTYGDITNIIQSHYGGKMKINEYLDNSDSKILPQNFASKEFDNDQVEIENKLHDYQTPNRYLDHKFDNESHEGPKSFKQVFYTI
jgi:seryl-tRNA synthetase